MRAGAVLRQTAYVVRLAGLRLLGRPAVAAVAVAGVALGAGAFTATVGGGLVVEERSVGDRFAALPAEQRSVQVTHFGVIPASSSYASVDAAARSAVRSLTGETPVALVKFKELRLGGQRVLLVAAEDASRFVTAQRGRLPRACSAARCELLIVRGRLAAGSLGRPFAVVGDGRLASSDAVASFVVAGSEVGGEAPGGATADPILLATGAGALAQLPALRSLYRTYAWLAPLGRSDVRVWHVGAFAREVAQRRNALRTVSDGFELSAPAAQLLEARHAGRVAERRLRLVGGQTAALLLAFAVFVAATVRRREQAAWQRLTWFGARRWQIVLLATLQALLLAVIGVAVGLLLGLLGAALIARAAGLPAGDVVGNALLTTETLVVVAALTAAAAAALLASLLSTGVRIGGRSFTTFDMAALAALAALALVLVLVREGDTSADGGSPLLLLAPGLALFVAAYAAARVLAPSTRGLQRLLARSAFPLRLAALSIARAPGQAVVAAAFLVVSVGLAVFALLYVTTLEQGIDDQAAYAVPADAVVRREVGQGAAAAPLAVAPLPRYRTLAPGTTVTPVLRERATASTLAGTNELTVLGLPAQELPGLDGWRDDFSSTPLATIARRLTPPAAPRLAAIAVPRDASELTLRLRVIGNDVAVVGTFVGRDGRFATADFGRTRGARDVTLRAAVGPPLTGTRLLGLRFARVSDVESHAHGGGPILRGVAVLGPLAATRPGGTYVLVADYARWTGVGGARPANAFGPNAVDYFVSEAADAFFRLRQPTDERPLAAAVSPGLARLANDDDLLAVQLGVGTVRLHVVATLRHFPSVQGSAVVVDRDSLAVALHGLQPGAGGAEELWLDSDSPSRLARALAEPPFTVLDADVRAELRHTLDADPLTRGTILLLLAATSIALVLGLVAVLFLAETDVRDGGGELLELETQGAEPAALRQHLRLRLLLVALPGVVAGAVAGIALSRLVVRFVELTLTADAAEPPLVLGADWALLLPTLAVFLAAAAAIAVLRSRAAFRAAYPGDERR